MNTIATTGNTVVPALLALEAAGFTISVSSEEDEDLLFRATRGEETVVAEDPVALLGLVKLVEMRGWRWHADDGEIDATMRRYQLS